MPEGDTVYRAAHALNAALAGQEVTRCDIRVPRYATIDLSGEKVDEVFSRGKHILMHVGAQVIHSHLKMEGSWHLYRHGTRWRRPVFQARAILETTGWVAVGFDLGELDIVPRDREDDLVCYLGPDLLGPGWDAAEAVRRLAKQPDQPIAVALLDQRNLAGIGNEYVNELCFLRGIRPTTPVGEVDLPAIVALSRRLLVANRDRVERTTTGDLRRGKRSWVFSRAGEPCRRCGAIIEPGRLGATETALRNTFSCPRCQR